MPYAWINGILNFSSYILIRLFGAAEPPHTTLVKFEVSYFPVSNSWSTPSQTVGTPAEIVTFSSSISSANIFGVKFGPGKTCVVPNQTAEKGTPQALT